jgi:hypothetical protein
MKKIFNNKLLFSAIVFSSLFISCNEDDNSTADIRFVKPIVTADATNFNLNEGETATITLTVNNPIKDDMDYKLELVGGSGSFRDFTCSGTETEVGDGWGIIGHMLHFPAYATTFSFDITAELDYLPEGTEELVFRLYSMGNSTGLVDAASETITVKIANTATADLAIKFDWASMTNAHGNIVEMEYVGSDGFKHSYADFDFDLIIVDPAGVNWDGATGAHPEIVYYDESDILSNGDGSYYVIIDLYDGLGPVTATPSFGFVPVLTVSKPGVWSHDFKLPNLWASTDQGSDNGDDDSYVAAEIVVSGSTYTLYDYNSGDELATGKTANISSLKNLIRGRKK